jgi:hypothetical protein
MACLATHHMHMTLNHIGHVEDESKEDKPIDMHMETISVVDMIIISYKDTTNARHICHISHFVKA